MVNDNCHSSQNCNSKAWLKKRILSIFAMIIKTYNVQLPENLMYLGLHPPKHERWKLHPCENFHFVNTLSSSHWPMNEPKFYPQVQILHRCVVSSLWAEPITMIPPVLNVCNWLIIMTNVTCDIAPSVNQLQTIGKLNMWTLFCNVCIDFLNSQIWKEIMLELNDKPSKVTTSSTDFSFQNLVFEILFVFSAAEIT